ncbi:MAG: hypothetical protein WCT04_01890 [Planctomycetota bacterium]
MSFYYYAGRALEVIGMTIVAAALLAGMGIDGNPSMAREIILLGIGGAVFTFGRWLETVR